MFHVEIIKDGDVTKVKKEILVDGQMYVDETPREGSANLVTSDGVNKAIGDTKESVDEDVQDLQEQIDDIAEKAGSGYTPKGPASVATLNGLTGQENGWLYTMTDAGTLTEGSLAVVAGDTVAWDATNSVWYKAMDYAPSQYGTSEIHNLPTTITDFRTGDVILVDGPSGTAKMPKDDLLREAAENALAGNVAPAFDATKNYIANNVVSHGGKVYRFKVNHPAGAWDASHVENFDLGSHFFGAMPNINSTSVYSSYNDLPNNAAFLVLTDLADSPNPNDIPWGICYTIGSPSSSYCVQIMTSASSNADKSNITWTRIKRAGTWGDWKQILSDASKFVNVINTINNTSTYSSFNDLPKNSSTFVFTDLADSPNPSNPDWGTCFTFSSNSGSYCSQLLITISSTASQNNILYIRNERNGTWGDWKKIDDHEAMSLFVKDYASKNFGTYTPEYYSLSCDNSGALTTLNAKRFSSDLVPVDNVVLVSIDPAYEYRMFLFDENKSFLSYFDWRSTDVSYEDIIAKESTAKYVRIYFSKKNDDALNYQDANAVSIFGYRLASVAISELANERQNEKISSEFNYTCIDDNNVESSGYDATRLLSRRFIPVGLVEKFYSKSSNILYRLALYTGDTNLSSDFVAFTSYTSGETIMSSVLETYPTAKFVRILCKKSNNSALPDNSAVYIKAFEKRLSVVRFERGSLTDAGTIFASSNHANNVASFACFRTGKFYDVNGNVEFESSVETDGTCYVFEYNDKFSFIQKKTISSKYVLSPYTKYVKFFVEGASGFPQLRLASNREFKQTFNAYCSAYISFLYEVANICAESVEVSDSDISQYSATPYFNSGILALPPNYDPNGEAVPLIIFNHGSSEYSYRSTRTLSYINERDYLMKEGFAILDCYGVSSKYSDGSTYYENPATPDNVACMVGAFKWTIANFNIAKEQVYTMGKSHGGLMTLALAYTKSIPIKACAFLCPLLNWFEQGVGLGSYHYENRVINANQLGFENVGALDTSALEVLYSDDYKTYIMGNIDKIKMYNPFLMGIDGTNASDLTEQSLDRNWDASIFASSRTCDTPMKVWGASDDGAVVWKQLTAIVNEVRNGKGIATLRRMPNGTGGHHSVDNDPDALKVASIVTKLGYTCVDVPLAYAEVVQWFRRF